jgi:thioredoxin 1
MAEFVNQYSYVLSAVFLWLLLALLLLRRRAGRRRGAFILGAVALFMLGFWLVVHPVQSGSPDPAAVRSQIGAGMPVLLEFQSPFCIGCVRARPVVDALESELTGKLKIIRLDVQSPAGSQVGQDYGFRYTPTFVLLDAAGKEIYRSIGSLDPNAVKSALQVQ